MGLVEAIQKATFGKEIERLKKEKSIQTTSSHTEMPSNTKTGFKSNATNPLITTSMIYSDINIYAFK